jgi:hypothetical protein
VKVALWIIGGLAGLAALVVLVGFLLPAKRTGKVDLVVEATPTQLTAVILDRASQPTWRLDLAKVEMHSATSWTETTQRGEVIAFELKRQDPNLLQMRFESSYGYQGQWEGRLVPAPSGGTHVFVTEQSTTPSPIGRIFARLFFNPEAFANAYLDALAMETQRRQTRDLK